MKNSLSHTQQHELRVMFMSGGVLTGPPRRLGPVWWPFSAKPSYLWCPRCHRGYRNGTMQLKDGIRRCPYGDCSAPERLARGWNEVRRVEAEYPETPEHGVRYTLRRLNSH